LQLRDDGERIHLHPEAVARVDVRGEVVAGGGELRERLEIVDERPRMELDADRALRVLEARELGEPGPVRRADLSPLAFVLALEVRQPAPCGEARPDVTRAAGEREHAVDA